MSRDFERELDEARQAGRAEGRQLDEARPTPTPNPYSYPYP